jgi:hypothetical protein
MKTKIEILMLCLLLVGFTTTAKTKEATMLSGQSLTELGDYQINQTAKKIIVGNEAVKTYELTYSNSDSPVLIGVQKTKKCMNFIVRSGNFEIMYVCDHHVFGVKRVGKEHQTIPAAEINKLMDNRDFYSQRVITQYPQTEAELLGLIACYFPSLIKDQYLSQL